MHPVLHSKWDLHVFLQNTFKPYRVSDLVMYCSCMYIQLIQPESYVPAHLDCCYCLIEHLRFSRVAQIYCCTYMFLRVTK